MRLKGKSDMISRVGIVLICVWDGGKGSRGNENLLGSRPGHKGPKARGQPGYKADVSTGTGG